jgi:hypothetical protein
MPHRHPHSIDEMRALVLQATRADERFCLIVCELDAGDDAAAQRSHAASGFMAAALREGDIAGLLAERRVAVLVPHATARAARPVVSRVQRHLHQATGDWRITVLSFPRHRALIERLADAPQRRA